MVFTLVSVAVLQSHDEPVQLGNVAENNFHVFCVFSRTKWKFETEKTHAKEVGGICDWKQVR